MRFTIQRSFGFGLALVAAACGQAQAGPDYVVTNLVSDIAGLAANTDTNLKNPWGVAYSPSGPFWVSNQGSNTSTLYNGAGTPFPPGNPLVVTIPTTTGGPNGPTGQVFNGNANDFTLSDGKAANFLFANLNGQIAGWNGGLGTAAQTVVPATGAIYVGLAIGTVGNNNVLYAADGIGNKIDVYDSKFNNLNGGSFAGAFKDPLLPVGYGVFNVQNINGTLFVSYSNPANGNEGTNGGVIAEFGLDGHFIKQLAASGPGGPLQAPWGMVMAPSNFGKFSNDLLVGNQYSGQINAYDPISGTYLGNVATVTNDPTVTNNGLWALAFGNGGIAGSTSTLYAFAGINYEQDGLIVAITSVPEPGSIVLTASAGLLATGIGFARRRRERSKAESA